jgi:hypothetical protein
MRDYLSRIPAYSTTLVRRHPVRAYRGFASQNLTPSLQAMERAGLNYA